MERLYVNIALVVSSIWLCQELITMVVVLNFSEQMGDTRHGYVILRSGHHPRVGFENHNNLCGGLKVGNVPWAKVCF